MGSTWCLRGPRRGSPTRKAGRLAGDANDPNETPIQYDLYRIPFNEGKGGVAEPIAGASQERDEQLVSQGVAGWAVDRFRARAGTGC